MEIRIKVNMNSMGSINWVNNWSTKLGLGYLPVEPKMNFTLGYIDSRTQENIYNYKNYIFKMNYQPFDAFSLSLKTSFEINIQ